MQLIAAEYSNHVRANVRVYQAGRDDFRVDWQFSHGSRGFRSFASSREALAYFAKLNPGLAGGDSIN